MLQYKELIVWQKAFDLAVQVYKGTEKFPDSEKFGLQSQMRRAVISISSNIAEGSKRGTQKDYIFFLRTAEGSAVELETQLLLAYKFNYIVSPHFEVIEKNLSEILKMLPVVISKLKSTTH